MRKTVNVQRLALYGMLIALAMILSYVETLIPVVFPVPGIKLGLANLVVIICLYAFGIRAAAAVSVLIAFTFGNLAALMFAVGGAVFSIICMLIAMKSDKFSMTGVSIVGGVSHNIGQILVAVSMVENLLVFSYLPYLMMAGLVSGLLIGLLAALIIKRIKPEIDRTEGKR